MEIIRSLDNNKVKLFASLNTKKGRDKNGLFIIQEQHLIEEAIKHNCLQTLIIREGNDNIYGVEAMYVSDAVMKKLSDNSSLNNYIAICCQKENNPKKIEKVFVLENVQDPGNVGTIIRTAYCFGYDCVYLSSECADLYNYKTISASQGAFFHIPVIRLNMEKIFDILKENGLYTYATSLSSSSFLMDTEIKEKFAIIMGNEGNGICQKTQEKADYRVKIEMENFDSLNVAIAAGIIGYQFKYKK